MNKTKTERLKILTILGTRPEIIRLSRILPKMDKYFNHIIVYTQQSYDYELSEIFFEELQLRKPTYVLHVKADTLGKQIGNILSQSEETMRKEKPDALLLLGDTNSTLSAIMAKRLKIPIFHIEAGNRCFDWNVPEEINRRIVDHISDFNLAYNEHAKTYLLREGIKPETIFVIGSPLAEVFSYYKSKINASKVLGRLNVSPKKYFVASIHREENVENVYKLKQLISALNYIATKYQLPIIVTLHPRTKKRLAATRFRTHSLVWFCKPFGYFDYNKLQKNALCVLSDSGTIQEESAMLRFNAIQIRDNTERPEAFDAGSIILIGLNKFRIINAIDYIIENQDEIQKIQIPLEYNSTNVSTKVVKLLMGWTSIKKNANNRIWEKENLSSVSLL